MPGREVTLWSDIAHLYTGGHPSKLKSDWDDPNAKHEWGPGKNPSSKNIYKLSRNIRLFVYLKYPSLYPKHLSNPIDDIIAIYEKEKKEGFMLNEQDSPIYWGFHLQLAIAVLYLSRTKAVSTQLIQLATDWLDTFITSCKLTSTGGQVYLCGQRGWDDDPPSHDIQEAMVFGTKFPKWLSKYHYGKFWLKVEDTLRTAVKNSRSLTSWPKMVPVHYVKFEKGDLTFVEKSINGNTPMRAAAVRANKPLVGNANAMFWEDNGKCGWFPGKVGRYRGRGKSDKATVTYDDVNQKLTYQAEYYAPTPVTVDLSGLGKVLSHQVWDARGLHGINQPPLTADTPPANPVEPNAPPTNPYYPNPRPKKWWDRFLDWL